jgi:hypothetical protein
MMPTTHMTARLQGTYVATELNHRPLPTDVVIQYRHHAHWFLVHAMAVSLMPPDRFALSFRYYYQPVHPDETHPALDPGPLRAKIIRGTYTRQQDTVTLRFTIPSSIPLPRTLKLARAGDDAVTITYESLRRGRLQRTIATFVRYYGWA